LPIGAVIPIVHIGIGAVRSSNKAVKAPQRSTNSLAIRERPAVFRLLPSSFVLVGDSKEAAVGPDPLRGKTIHWTYDDGPMAGKRFEHTFGDDGTVTWREAGRDAAATKPPTDGTPKGAKATDARAKYEVAAINEDVCAVSYLSESGFTLTSVLDFDSGTVVSFASNEKELIPQRGMFEVAQRV
jgi:MoaF N-terminal domain